MTTLAELPPSRPGRVSGRVRRALQWSLDKLLLFLEIIGLLAPRSTVEHAAQLARFRVHHTAFRRLLGANDSFLRAMADFERKLLGQDPFDVSYLRRASVRMVADVYGMVESLNEISSNRYPSLRTAFQSITDTLSGIVDTPQELESPELCVDVSEMSRASCAQVGGKLANLAEVRNHVGLPTPDGFSVTVHAYRRFAVESGLDRVVRNQHAGLEGPGDVERISALLTHRIEKAEVPTELAEAILAAYDRLSARAGTAPRMAVRSSAVGEDGTRSFAGQYATVLNVDRNGLLDAWKQVVASLYSREAIHYRLLHGLPGDQAVMAVGFVVMVEAVASGIAFSLDPARPDSGRVLVHAVSGLGTSLADGTTTPESLAVELDGETASVRRTASQQSSQQVCDATVGVVERPVPLSSAERPLVSDEEAIQIARWGRVLEAHFGCPQDLEWALGADRRILLLQSRPLHVAENKAVAAGPVPAANVLLRGGDAACPGFASGPACHMDEDGDFDAFPRGAVLVAKRSSPKFVGLMAKAAAIVTDAGSTTGHMASLAREFRIPTLLGLREATALIPDGTVVTVDSAGGFVYEGAIPMPENLAEAASVSRATDARGHQTPAWQMLERAAELVVPLTLGDARLPGFRPESCTTLHDVVRFVHEKSYEEMFRMGESLGDIRSGACQLDVFLPIDLYIIDLGGGLSGVMRGNKVTMAQIQRSPLAALMRGMLHKKIPRFGARPIDVGGFFSIMMRHAVTNPEQERTFRDPCYALVSDKYLNYTARVGYHFGVVDAYCGDTANKNYINMLFRGGAADVIRRSRRARAIAGIVKELGFSAQVEQDSVHARISKTNREETERLLDLIGRMLQFMRQMDVAMTSERAVHQVKEAFLREDYALAGQPPEAGSSVPPHP